MSNTEFLGLQADRGHLTGQKQRKKKQSQSIQDRQKQRRPHPKNNLSTEPQNLTSAVSTEGGRFRLRPAVTGAYQLRTWIYPAPLCGPNTGLHR